MAESDAIAKTERVVSPTVMVGVLESVTVTRMVLTEVLRSSSAVVETTVAPPTTMVMDRMLVVVVVKLVVEKVNTVLVVEVVVTEVRKLVRMPETVSEKEVTVTEARTSVSTVWIVKVRVMGMLTSAVLVVVRRTTLEEVSMTLRVVVIVRTVEKKAVWRSVGMMVVVVKSVKKQVEVLVVHSVMVMVRGLMGQQLKQAHVSTYTAVSPPCPRIVGNKRINSRPRLNNPLQTADLLISSDGALRVCSICSGGFPSRIHGSEQCPLCKGDSTMTSMKRQRYMKKDIGFHMIV